MYFSNLITPCKLLNVSSLLSESLTELEKIFEIAVNGSDCEKISAASILCGASLSQGWNVQVINLIAFGVVGNL